MTLAPEGPAARARLVPPSPPRGPSWHQVHGRLRRAYSSSFLLLAMASNLLAMASTLAAMASNLASCCCYCSSNALVTRSDALVTSCYYFLEKQVRLPLPTFGESELRAFRDSFRSHDVACDVLGEVWATPGHAPSWFENLMLSNHLFASRSGNCAQINKQIY